MKWILNVLIVVLFGILLAVLIIPLQEQARPSKIRIMCPPTMASLPIFVAQEAGIFKERKVDAKIVLNEAPDDMLKALSEGNTDIIVVPWVNALKWLKEGKDTIRCFFSVKFKLRPPLDGIVTTRKIRTLREARGKKVATSNFTKLSLDIIKKTSGVKLIPEIYSLKELPKQLENNPLVFAVEPYLTLCKLEGGEIVESGLMNKWISSPYPETGMFITNKFLEEEKLGLIRFKEAMDLAYLFIHKNRDSTRLILSKRLNIPLEATEDIPIPSYERVHEIDKTTVQILADRLVPYGVLSERVETEFIFVSPSALRR